MNRVAHSHDTMLAWPLVSPWLERALDKTSSLMTVGDLLRGVRSGAIRLWLVHRSDRLVGAFATEIGRFSNGAAVNVLALGGIEMPDWIESFDEAVETYARENGCCLIVEMGRPGWKRVLSKLGWVDGPVVMMKVTR